jgi:hypothetical protein
VRKFDLQPPSITAALVGLKNRAEVFRLQRYINEFAREPLMTVLPGMALDELWRAIAIVEHYLVAMAALAVFVSLIGLIATLLAGLEQCRRELAILRSLGARPWQVMLMLAMEGACVTDLGVGLGVGLLAAAGVAVAPWLQGTHGITLHPWVVGTDDLWKLGVVVLVGTVVSLVLGWRAWRLSLTDGLTPRLCQRRRSACAGGVAGFARALGRRPRGPRMRRAQGAHRRLRAAVGARQRRGDRVSGRTVFWGLHPHTAAGQSNHPCAIGLAAAGREHDGAPVGLRHLDRAAQPKRVGRRRVRDGSGQSGAVSRHWRDVAV